MNKVVLKAHHLQKGFPGSLPLWTDFHLEVEQGSQVAIMGRSGSGKSTLLNCLGLLELPDAGEIWIEGRAVHRRNEAERTRIRSQSIGFVFQSHHLLKEFSALENVMMPLWIQQGRNIPADRAYQLLADLGLKGKEHRRPAQLSGGERQRVAIARALVGDPALILADEPTGNLDVATAASVMAALQEQVRAHQTAIIVVTHDQAVAEGLDRIITLA